jgi:hypothetical protein
MRRNRDVDLNMAGADGIRINICNPAVHARGRPCAGRRAFVMAPGAMPGYHFVRR